MLILICAFTIYLYAHHNWNSLPAGTTIDRIVVEKSARRLSMFRGGNQIKTYRIALGASPVGAKREEGDMKTPEGIYKIDGRNPQSSFHLALHISYPSDDDNKRAAAHGVSAGSDIMIHGIQNGRVGSARFIAGTIGPPAASQLPTKRSRNCGALQQTARRLRFFPKAPRARVALFRHLMAAE